MNTNSLKRPSPTLPPGTKQCDNAKKPKTSLITINNSTKSNSPPTSQQLKSPNLTNKQQISKLINKSPTNNIVNNNKQILSINTNKNMSHTNNTKQTTVIKSSKSESSLKFLDNLSLEENLDNNNISKKMIMINNNPDENYFKRVNETDIEENKKNLIQKTKIIANNQSKQHHQQMINKPVVTKQENNFINQEAYRHFKDSLFTDLTQNLKPVIMSLTMLAEDYYESCSCIAKAIEEYILQVSPDLKILGLYLMDSIMKNVKSTNIYIKTFEINITNLFEQVFKSVDESNRKALYKLRQTWNELFKVQTLYDIDVKIKKIDPAWPITAILPTTNNSTTQSQLNQQTNKSEIGQIKSDPNRNITTTTATTTSKSDINQTRSDSNKNITTTTTTTTTTKTETNNNKKIPSLFELELSNPSNKTVTQKSAINSTQAVKKPTGVVSSTPIKNQETTDSKPKQIQKQTQSKQNPQLTKKNSANSSPPTKNQISNHEESKTVKKIKLSPSSSSKTEKQITKPKPTEQKTKQQSSTIHNTFNDVDERFIDISTSSTTKTVSSQPAKTSLNIDLNLVKSLLENPLLSQIIQQTATITPSSTSTTTTVTSQKKSTTFESKETESKLLDNDDTTNITDLVDLNQLENETNQIKEQQSDEKDDYVSYDDLPPIKPKDVNENQNDSLLIIDARSYRIQPDIRRIIKIYYHDHEIFCDTRTKDVYVDQKRVAKMGDNTKEIMLNGRRVRLMYMGRRIELWIDGVSFHFRADSPPKQISLSSSHTNQLKRYYVTIDSRTMDMFFNNFKVCNINGGPYGQGANVIMARLSPDDYEQHEISFICPPKRIMIDGIPRKMRYDLSVPCIEMNNGEFHVIRFSGSPRDIYIDDEPFKVAFDKTVRIKLNGRAHELAWGGPGFEVIIDGRPYELQFNKPAREIIIGTRPHFVYICGDAPDVKICGRLPQELTQVVQHEEVKQTQQPTRPPPLMSQPIEMPPSLAASQAQAISTLTTTTGQKIPNVQELLQKLIQHKILPSGKQQEEKGVIEDAKVPDLTDLESDLLKQKYPSAIKSLYSGIQCAQCGNRFNQHETSGTNASSRYARHLDWHFRQNKKEKEEINKAHSRAWYYDMQDWVLYEEISEENQELLSGQQETGLNKNKLALNENDLEMNRHGEEINAEDILSTSTNKAILLKSYNSYNGIKTCPATDDIGDSCCICNDPFEIFWFSEKEEWHFKDAIRFENRLYHPICFEDNRDESFANTTMNQTEMNVSNVKDEPINF